MVGFLVKNFLNFLGKVRKAEIIIIIPILHLSKPILQQVRRLAPDSGPSHTLVRSLSLLAHSSSQVWPTGDKGS